MIRIKNNGFTLIEVLLALALSALVLTPVLLLLGTNVPAVARSSYRLARFLAAKTVLDASVFKSLYDPQYSLKKVTVTDPQVTLSFKQQAIDQREEFKAFPGIVKQEVVMEWTDRNKKMTDSLITFMYRPEQKKKKS